MRTPDRRLPLQAVIFKRDPDCSERARKAKYNGTVALLVEIDATGQVRSVKVIGSAGMGAGSERGGSRHALEVQGGHEGRHAYRDPGTVGLGFPAVIKGPAHRHHGLSRSDYG
jgi:hypothetical protein